MISDYGISIDDLILVSCTTVTKGRVDLIQHSIRSFLSQTYMCKEMIIVSQGTSEQNSVIRNMVLEHINIHFVEAPSKLTLGEMRNLSIELSHGDVICQWDDDDFYHPQRIMTQLKSMRGEFVASLYTRYLKYFSETKRIYMIDHLGGTDDYVDLLSREPYKKYLCGSVMFKKECFYKCENVLYPERGYQSNKQEDLNVLQKLIKIGKIASVDACEYCYVYHGGNVYDKQHHEMLFHKKLTGTQKQLIGCIDDIQRILKVAQVNGPVEVCTVPMLDLTNPSNFNIENNSQPIYTLLCK